MDIDHHANLLPQKLRVDRMCEESVESHYPCLGPLVCEANMRMRYELHGGDSVAANAAGLVGPDVFMRRC